MIDDSYIVVANGEFPTHSIPLNILASANKIICCDGAINQLETIGLNADYIIGDMDSIEKKLKNKYSDKIIKDNDQSENDLRKALKWLRDKNIKKITIIGGTGKRDDHSLGNIFTLLQYPTNMKINMYTNFGYFSIIEKNCKIDSYKGQQISIFCIDPDIKITSINLKYKLNNISLSSLYKGTLNESMYKHFTLNLSHGKILLFQTF
tara:strand:+ start:220 stop:840 length:621 start_codon:yes stop_codon:yes gene_type:complete